MAGLTAAELEAVVGIDDSPFSAGLDKLTGMFEGWGGKAGAVLGGIGVVGGGLFAAGLAGGINLDEVQGRIASELGLTKDQAAKYGDITGKVYANNFGDSLDEVGDAVTTVVSSIRGMRKASDAEVQGMTQKLLTLKSVFDVDLGKSAEVIGVMLKNGMAKDGAQAADILTSTFQKVPKALREDVLDAAEEYSQFFHAVGIDGPKAFGMLAAGSAKGMYGIDKIGDAVKEFTIRGTDMSASTKSAYKAIGLDTKKMTDDLLAGGDRASGAFHTIVKGVEGIKSPAKRSQVALALFGTPLEDLGTKDIPKFLHQLDGSGKGLGKFAGSTDKAAKSLSDNAGANLAQFGRQLKMHVVDFVGGKAVPVINNLTGVLATGLGPAFQTAGEWAGKFGGWIEDNQTPIKIIAGLITALLLPALVVMGTQALIAAAKVAMSWAISSAGAVASAGLQIASHTLIGLAWLKTGAQALIGAGRMAAAWFIGLGPIGWAIAAVALVVAVVIKYWDKISAATSAVWGAVSGFVTGAWHKIVGGVSAGVSAVIGFVKKRWPLILSILTGPIGAAVIAIARNWSKIKAGASDVVNWIKGIPGKISALGGRFGTAGRNLLQKFINGMKNAAGIISGIAGNVWSAVKGLINGAIGRINSALDFTIHLPGPDLHVNIADIPKLATGGRATGATLAVIGEGREPESVLPDSVLRGLMGRAHAAGAGEAQMQAAREMAQAVKALADRGVDASGIRDVIFQGKHEAGARELVSELDHMLRVMDVGGPYVGADS